MLGFAEVAEGDVSITAAGQAFADADIERSWQVFRQQLLQTVPFVSTVLGALREKRSGGVKKEFFVDILDEHFSQSEAEQQFQTLISWGRYAHLFDYSSDEERLYLSDESPADPV